jgi:hypothetical protein
MPTADCTTFARIAVADLLDFLCEAVDAARVAAAGNTRWLNAIDAAWGWLLEQDAVSFDHTSHALRVESASEAGKVYIANGSCQCKSFAEHGNACWHRAGARLVRRALELRTMDQGSDLLALAEELVSDAHAAGAAWYGMAEGIEGAKMRERELADFAAEWDAAAAAAKAAALGARLGAAQARVMAAAA